MGKKSPKPPPAPDYAAAAQQQGVANLDAARLTARLSNPNIKTPLGGQRVTFGRQQVDEAAYRAAMQQWQARQPKPLPDPSTKQANKPPEAGGYQRTSAKSALPPPNADGTFTPPAPTGGPKGNQRPPETGSPSMVDIGGGAFQPGAGQRIQMGGGTDLGVSPSSMNLYGGMKSEGMAGRQFDDGREFSQGGGNRMDSSMGAQFGDIGAGEFVNRNAMRGAQNAYMGDAMPTRDMFTSMVDLDTPNIEQYLTPEAQATLEAQQRVERSLAGLGEQAIGRVSNIYGTNFTPQGLPDQQFSFGGYGDIGEAPDLAAMGQARGNVNALPVNYGPTAGQYGFAGGGPQGLNLQGFDASGLGMAGGGPGGGAFGAAQGGVGAPSLRGQYDLTGVGDVSRAPGAAAMAQGGPMAPGLQGQLDTSNLAAMPVNAGMTAQQAIMSRLDPQLQRQRSQLETQLANQGLVRGGEAYGAAITEQQQQENDLRTQAALQGLSLDMAARQQGLGEAQARGGFANQSALAGFGAGQQATAAQNAAGQQNFQNALARQAAENQAQSQAFGQRAQAGQFGNEAQLAAFQAAMQNQAAGNQAIGQNFGQSQSAQAMANQAQAQNFQQRMAAGEFGRQGQLSSFQTQQAAQDAANRAIAQNFQQGIGAAGAYNTAAGQQFGQDMDIAGLQNAALSQNQQTALQQAQARAAMQGQRFNQAQSAASFQNAQRQAALQEQLALRSQPLNEIAAIMGGAQVQMPQFQAYQGADVAAAPIFGAQQAAGNFAQQNYANQTAAYNSKMGLYGSLAGGLGAAAGGGFFGSPFGKPGGG
jgi:hypothetical protein